MKTSKYKSAASNKGQKIKRTVFPKEERSKKRKQARNDGTKLDKTVAKPAKQLASIEDCKSENKELIFEATTFEPKSSSHQHEFETNVLDHCETPREAYHHLNSFLEMLGKLLKIQPSNNLRIWDPFYCNGSMKAIFQEMGFQNIIHENADFYQLIRDQKIPDHDILVTNPPYSDDHIPRLLDFALTNEIPNQRPCCLLLPNWVARQPDYDQRFSDVLTQQGHELFYLSPLQTYTYTMPTWVSQEDRPEHVGSSGKTTPYLSSWYLVVPKELKQKRIWMDQMDMISKQQKPPIWVVAKTIKGLKWKIKKWNGKTGGKEKVKKRTERKR